MTSNEQVFQCQFQLGIGSYYHMLRQSYFNAWHRFVSAFSLIFSTSAVAIISSKLEIGIFCAAIVAVLQAVDLIIDTRGQGSLHNDLRNKYLMLEHELLNYGSSLTELQFNDLQMKIKSIELQEPPVRKLLLEVCHDDIARRLKVDKAHFHNVHWFKANTANMFNWPSVIKD